MLHRGGVASSRWKSRRLERYLRSEVDDYLRKTPGECVRGARVLMYVSSEVYIDGRRVGMAGSGNESKIQTEREIVERWFVE